MTDEIVNLLPKIKVETLKQVNALVIDKIQSDEIMDWAKDIFNELRKNNPVLYEFMMDNTNKFVAGCRESNPAEIAASKILSDLILIFLLNQAIKRGIDSKEWEKGIGRLLNGIDFGDKE